MRQAVDQTINMDWVDRLGADLRTCWRFGQRLPVEEYLKHDTRLNDSAEAILVLIYHEVAARRELGESPCVVEYLARFPHLAVGLRKHFPDETAVHPESRSNGSGEPGALATGASASQSPGNTQQLAGSSADISHPAEA